MVENRPWLTFLTHVVLILGMVIIAFPIYVTFVASTHSLEDITTSFPYFPGSRLIENYTKALSVGPRDVGATVGTMMLNSLIMALGITIGKISISLLAAFAIVYFRFRFRMLFFWMIFITLMLPVEVRILPTYKVAADLHLLDSYPGADPASHCLGHGHFFVPSVFSHRAGRVVRIRAHRRRRAVAVFLGHPAAHVPHLHRRPVRHFVHLRLEPVFVAFAHHRG